MNIENLVWLPEWLPAIKQNQKNWSGWGDLNSRPPAPKAGALPDCATSRIHIKCKTAPIGNQAIFTRTLQIYVERLFLLGVQ